MRTLGGASALFAPALAAAAALGLLCCSCGTNPLASGALSSALDIDKDRPQEPMPTPVTWTGQADPLNVFFAPQDGVNTALDFLNGTPPANFVQGGAYLDTGSEWTYATVLPGTLLDATGYEPFDALQLPAALTSNASHYFNNVWLRGGPGGDQFSINQEDYYVRFEGSYTGAGLPNGSLNYFELPIYFFSNAGPGVDLSSWHGFSFWTRGSGNFSVCLVSGSLQGSPPAAGPYDQLNLYQYLFNGYLNGSTQWRQVVVYFSEMTQTYGTATPLNQVLQQLYGLQFMQMGSPGPPVQPNCWLDVDYIRFF